MSRSADAAHTGSAPVGPASGETAADMLDALWAEVVGQQRLVADLRAAAADPVHAYLLVGPEGTGKRAAARAFAAELIALGLDEADARRAVSLIGGGVHPSVHIVERMGAAILVEEARDVVKAAARAPSEGHLQVFILDEFHLVGDAAPILLKAIEEPSQSTLFIVLAEEITDGLITIASRCARHSLPRVPVDSLRDALIAQGVEPETASAAALGADGSFRRALLLAGDTALVERREAWHRAPERLDGTGATLCVLADDLLELVDGVVEPVTARHDEEVEAFEEMVEMTGNPAKGRRKAMEDRHKREVRRLRTGELISGALAVLGSYRSAAGDGSGDSTEAYLRAVSSVQRFTDAIHANANEALALRALMSALDRRI